MSNIPLTNKSLTSLANMKRLEYVGISDIPGLGMLPRLKRLSVYGRNSVVDWNVFEALKAARGPAFELKYWR